MLALGTAANIATLGYYGLSQPIIKILTATSYSIPIVGSVSKEFNKLSNAAKNAYEIAKGGGRHAGMLNNIIKDNIRISLDKTGKIINVLVERKINWTRFKELE